MPFTLFGSMTVAAVPESVDYPTAAKHLGMLNVPFRLPTLYKKIEEISLNNLQTRLLDFTNYASTQRVAIIAKVNGSCRINTVGFDTNGITAITGKFPIFGTALYPGIGILSTYNVTSFTFEALADGTVIELFAAILVSAAGSTAVGKDTIGVYHNVDQALTEAGIATLAFNTELVDSTSAFAANIYTCINAGNYRISCTGSLSKDAGSAQPGDQFIFRIQKNGISIGINGTISAGPTVADSAYKPFAMEADVPLIVGDTIKIAVIANIGGGRTFTGSIRGISLAIDQS